MPFHPQVDDQLTIGDVVYQFAEHPAAPEMPYGQAGRQAVVYQLVAGDEHRTLKVFKPRYRFPGLVSLAQRIAPYADLPGLSVCRRVVLSARQHRKLLRQLSWPKNTSVLKSTVMEVESRVADHAESGELMGTADEITLYDQTPRRRFGGCPL